MKFKTFGNRKDPAVLFFHAMGVTGESSEPVAKYLQDRYFCILPTSTVYCKGQKYISKADEVRQVEEYLKLQGVECLELQKRIYFEFGSIEEHFKYRQAVMEAYPCGHYPIFEGYDHMQYQIRDPKGFAEMLTSIAAQDEMPKLPFIRKGENPIGTAKSRKTPCRRR